MNASPGRSPAALQPGGRAAGRGRDVGDILREAARRDRRAGPTTYVGLGLLAGMAAGFVAGALWLAHATDRAAAGTPAPDIMQALAPLAARFVVAGVVLGGMGGWLLLRARKARGGDEG